MQDASIFAVVPVPKARLRALVVPREHGAWGILLVPLSTGAAVAGLSDTFRAAPLLTFLSVAIVLFWMRTPVESLLGTTPMRVSSEAERAYVKTVIGVMSTLAVALLLALAYQGRIAVLAVLGAVAGSAFAVQAWIRRFGRRMRLPAQIIGTLGLTSTAAAAYYSATGHLGRVAFALWLLNFLFAAEQIESVQLRIRSARVSSGKDRLQRSIPVLTFEAAILICSVLLWRVRVMPLLGVFAFAPAIARSWSWIARPAKALNVHRLGWQELANGIAFGLTLVAAYALHS